MSKSPEMEKFLNDFALNTFGRSRTQSLAGNVCVMCGGEANEFRNAISRKEYGISGMCQKCQDSFFDAD